MIVLSPKALLEPQCWTGGSLSNPMAHRVDADGSVVMERFAVFADLGDGLDPVCVSSFPGEIRVPAPDEPGAKSGQERTPPKVAVPGGSVGVTFKWKARERAWEAVRTAVKWSLEKAAAAEAGGGKARTVLALARQIQGVRDRRAQEAAASRRPAWNISSSDTEDLDEQIAEAEKELARLKEARERCQAALEEAQRSLAAEASADAQAEASIRSMVAEARASIQ